MERRKTLEQKEPCGCLKLEMWGPTVPSREKQEFRVSTSSPKPRNTMDPTNTVAQIFEGNPHGVSVGPAGSGNRY